MIFDEKLTWVRVIRRPNDMVGPYYGREILHDYLLSRMGVDGLGLALGRQIRV
jgi:hypothetical protein